MAGGAEGSGIRFEVLLISRSHPLSSARAGGMIIPYETLYSNSVVAVCMEDPEGRPVWKVTLRLRGGGCIGIRACCTIPCANELAVGLALTLAQNLQRGDARDTRIR